MIAVSWSYACLVALWLILHAWLGDSIWWLALVNAFVPFIFALLPLLVLAALALRRRALLLSVVPPAVVFLLLFGQLFLPRLSPHVAASTTAITVTSFNVWAFSCTPDTLDAVLGDGSADIVALQEVGPQMRELLAHEGWDRYPHRVHEASPQGCGISILGRYPLAPLVSPNLAGNGGRVQAVLVDVEAATSCSTTCTCLHSTFWPISILDERCRCRWSPFCASGRTWFGA